MSYLICNIILSLFLIKSGVSNAENNAHSLSLDSGNATNSTNLRFPLPNVTKSLSNGTKNVENGTNVPSSRSILLKRITAIKSNSAEENSVLPKVESVPKDDSLPKLDDYSELDNDVLNTDEYLKKQQEGYPNWQEIRKNVYDFPKVDEFSKLDTISQKVYTFPKVADFTKNLKPIRVDTIHPYYEVPIRL